jgi:predicted nucleotidyltransferase component of viral defense system
MKVLTDLQESTLKAFFDEPALRQHFYLTGGTALAAFHLEHRLSDDLDFFTHSIALDAITPIAEDCLSAVGQLTKERSSPTFRRYRLDNELQIDVVRDIDYRLGAPELRDNFMVDTVKNIAVNKVTAMYGRLDAKDYVDLYLLIQKHAFDIVELIDWAKHKDAGMEAFQWAKIIADVDTFTVLPRMLVDLDLATLKAFFHDMRGSIIDSLKTETR